MTQMDIVEDRWRALCKWGGISAFVIAVLLLGEVFVYAALPSPNTPAEIFELFDKSWLLGLLHFDLLGMISYLFFIPFTLALYVSLRRSDETIMLIASVLFFIGVAAFFATNTGFSVLSLTRQYALAATQGERDMLLAAGQAMITLFNVNAFLVSYVLVSAGWMLMGLAMLRSSVFSRLASSAAMLAGASGLIAEFLENVSRNLVGVAVIFYFAAIVFLFIWVVATGTRLYKMS